MELALRHTDEWSKLKDLDEEELLAQVKEHHRTYGEIMIKVLNSRRNTLQQEVRQAHMQLQKEGVCFGHKQLLKVV